MKLFAIACAAACAHAVFTPALPTERDAGHMYYKLRATSVITRSVPTMSAVRVMGNGGDLLRPERVMCEASNEAYCNGALLGAGPASWQRNCRNLGVRLSADATSSFVWKFPEATPITDLQFWLSGTECQGAQMELLAADAVDGPWTSLHSFKLEKCGCDEQWTNVHVQDFRHCRLSAADWEEWGDCSKKCGGGTQTRALKSISQYPSGGGNGCDLEKQKMEQQCNRHACPCPPGQYHNPVNCASCPAGRFSKHRGSSTCAACQPGMYTAQPGASACDMCAPGTASAAEGAVSACAACGPGRFQDRSAASVCKACRAGTFSPTVTPYARTACTGCEPGTYSAVAAATTCTACEVGKFRATDYGTSCTACPAGQYLEHRGTVSSAECTKCTPGRWAAGPVARCTRCLGGRYQPARGASSLTHCRPCARGSFSDGGAAECITCDEGSYAASEGSTTCRRCACGKYSTARGATSVSTCQECARGTFSDDGAAQCTKCAGGTFGTKAGACPSDCSTCGSGTHALPGATKCTKCEMGRYSEGAGAESCAKCAKGKYGYAVAATSRSVCRPCTSGKFQAEEGQVRCWECGRGRYQPAQAQEDCIDCAPGTYGAATASSAAGFKSCVECAAGKFQDGAGASSCKACPGQATAQAPNIVGARSVDRCSKCEDASCPVDCEPEAMWSEWSACSTTCGKGVHTRTRKVKVHAANGGNECHTQPGSHYSLVEEKACVETPCPVDCVLEPWSPWSTCTVSCGQGGVTRRTTEVKLHPQHGGKACGPLQQSAQCNTHRCYASGQCADHHMKCRVVEDKDAKKNSPATIAHAWAQHCDGTKMTPLAAMHHHRMPADPRCDPSFCQRHNNCKRLEVEHFPYDGKWESDSGARDGEDNVLAMGKDQRATVLSSIDRSTFKCSRTGADTCKCYCTKHRECCFKPGKRIKGTALLGNTYNTVRSRQDCCNLCTNHPNCQGWTFRASFAKCVLKGGNEFEDGDDDEIAGLRYSAVAKC